ncbi:MAG: hypothetical protein KAI40_12675, partial [Desulfobacterales bacterium]|nr:hypothetical protein [Desulfobacterales bacterium]
CLCVNFNHRFQHPLREKYFFTSQKTRSEQIVTIAKQTDIQAKIVHDALFGDVEDEHDFISKSVVLQNLTNNFKGSFKR